MTGKIRRTKNYLNYLLFYNNDYFFRFLDKIDNERFRFLVHCDIVGHIEMFLHDLEINSKYEVLNYPLKVGRKLYEMCLVSFAKINEKQFRILCTKIRHSQHSFVWARKPNLFIEVGSFKILEEFISELKLEQRVIDVKEQPGINDNDNIIKVVTFNPIVNRKFDNTVDKLSYYHGKYHSEYQKLRPKYYYMAFAFEWLSPQWLEPIYIKDNCYSALFITLTVLSHTSCFNIIDLISLRWALFQNRKCPLKTEIDYLINRELSKFIENNHLDLDKYASAKNIYLPENKINYFIYEFQNWFKTFKFEKYIFGRSHNIKLVDEVHVLNKIRNNRNIEFHVDGSGYDQMSLSLFLDLIKCRNVISITLDTNYMWRLDVCQPNIRNIHLHYEKAVALKGENTDHFIEDFVSSLKTIENEIPIKVGLSIYGNQNIDYSSFDNIIVNAIVFRDINIKSDMLKQLHTYNLEAAIYFVNCNLENTHDSWSLLMELNDQIDELAIDEDEGTWQRLFEFVWDEMVKTNSIEFRFDESEVSIISFNHERIKLGDKIFKINEQKDKLDMYDAGSNEIIDIYCSKNNIEPDDKSDYDFYQ